MEPDLGMPRDVVGQVGDRPLRQKTGRLVRHGLGRKLNWNTIRSACSSRAVRNASWMYEA